MQLLEKGFQDTEENDDMHPMIPSRILEALNEDEDLDIDGYK